MLHPDRTLRLHLLGRPRLSADGGGVLPFKAPARALSLLAYLLVHRDAPVGRDAAAFALWPDETEAGARANLRRQLFALVNDGLPAPAPAAPWIIADKRTVRWNPDAPAWADVAEFDRLAAADEAAAAVALYGGELLEGFEDEWLEAPRERLREQQLRLLLELIAQARASGAHADGIEHARRLLALDPWREDGVRALIAFRAAAGDRAGALATYREFVKRLDDELGVPPMAETTAEFERVSRQEEPPLVPIAPRSDGIGNPAALRATPIFTGRELELAALDDALWAGGGAAVIHGLGGIGKSALAREYARRRRERYAAVWLLDAETESGIVDGLVRLGATVMPTLAEAGDRRAAAERVVSGLVGGFAKPVLLIFDNLDAESLLRPWMPPENAHVLVTSRQAAWGGDVVGVRLTVWSPEESAHFLRSASGRRDLTDDELTELAHALGSLPLAVAHAAAYLKATPNVTGRRYLARLNDHLSRAPSGAEYDRAVLATFEEAIVRAERDVPGAAALLAFAAYFAPDAIPESLVRGPLLGAGAALVPSLPGAVPALALAAALADPDGADEALAALHRLSLIVFAPEVRAYTVHRLVRAAARRLLAADHEGWARAALATVEAAFPAPAFAAWARCEQLLPHALAVLDAMPDGKPCAPAARLASRCGTYLAKRAAFAEAERLLRRGVAFAAAEPGGALPEALAALAGMLRGTNRAAEAEPLLQRALGAYEAELGPEHCAIAPVLNELAILAQYGNRLEEAEALFRRALALDEAAHGSEHPRVALRLHNLAVVLHERNRLDEAEPLFRRALAIDEAQLGPDDPGVAADLANVAWLVFTRGRSDEAEPLMRRALALREAAYGDRHPSYAFALSDLAVLLHDGGRVDDAERLSRRALELCEASFGDDHPIVAAQLNSLAELLADIGTPDDAERLYRRALAIDEASFGTAHPNVARDLNNLAGILMGTGRRAEAEALVARARAVVEAAYPPDHPRVAVIRENLDASRWRNIRRSPSRGLRE